MTATTDATVPLAGGGQLPAAVAQPLGNGPFPGVVVLHEIYGLNDDIRRVAGRFADNGYVALAPDLFAVGNRLLCLTRAMIEGQRGRGTSFDLIEAARAHLASRPDVDANRLAIIGFCMGGGFALAFAARPGTALRATSINYGAVPKDRNAIESVCPVVGSFGGKDRIFGPQAKRLEDHLTALGVPHDVKLYPDAGHSFMGQTESWLARLPNPTNPGYSEPDAEDAWARILAFFAEHV
ncbi:MAG: carboxymethylenebutenolidase [Actinomycetota bacterium]|jgi:carboxymethylenebutenolidase|nr:carboxymethylenebutenolidase [Actinomycetota bacterium]